LENQNISLISLMMPELNFTIHLKI